MWFGGAEARDGVTPTGTAQGGATVEVTFQGNAPVVTATKEGTRSSNFATGKIYSGTYGSTVTARATDAAGNVATDSHAGEIPPGQTVSDGCNLVIHTTDTAETADTESLTLLIVDNTSSPAVDLWRDGLDGVGFAAIELSFAPKAQAKQTNWLPQFVPSVSLTPFSGLVASILPKLTSQAEIGVDGFSPGLVMGSGPMPGLFPGASLGGA